MSFLQRGSHEGDLTVYLLTNIIFLLLRFFNFCLKKYIIMTLCENYVCIYAYVHICICIYVYTCTHIGLVSMSTHMSAGRTK